MLATDELRRRIASALDGEPSIWRGLTGRANATLRAGCHTLARESIFEAPTIEEQSDK